MTEATLIQRRYELDWLRVLAFALLIFYHTGMLYVERWGFHYKSQYLSSTLEYLMLASSPWRMLLIWLISGYALGAVLQRVSHWQQYGQLALKRTVVLLLPLMVGLWFIVPPQLYAEMVQKDGLSLSYWQFYQAFFDLSHPLFNDYRRGVWPHVDVNHLWYLRSLWKFTLVLLLLAPLLYWSPLQRQISRVFALPLGWQLLLYSTLLFISRYWLESDARRDVQGFGYFLLGAALESFLVIVLTLLGSLAFVLLFWQLPWCAALVGLKTHHAYSSTQRRWGYAVALLIVSPLVLTLLF